MIAAVLRPAVLCFAVVLAFAAPARAATEATLLRLFLNDGGTIVSFGEFARIDDRVIFSMPAGGPVDAPRLHVVSLPADAVDWDRTERYAASARYQWYAATRGEADFDRLSTDVARVLNEIALNTDRRRALELAESARATLAAWPAEHFGYRQDDVQEIVGLLDEAVSNLRAALGISEFSLELVAAAPMVPLEPVLGMPSVQEQLSQLLRVAVLTDRPGDRVALLYSALAMIDDPLNGLSGEAIADVRSSVLREIRAEEAIDARYTDLSQRLMRDATRAAADADIEDVEKVLARVPREDEKLGHRRPEQVQALRVSLQARLDDARRLRLLKDRWTIRQALYRDWQRSAGVQLLQLVRLQPVLQAIQAFQGPEPDVLIDTRRRLAGGADRLQRIGVGVPDDLRGVNDLLIGAWRFAETAVTSRFTAVSQGSLATARDASSAAAGALLMLERAQQEIRNLLEPPRLR